jgi:hypothetical protein
MFYLSAEFEGDFGRYRVARGFPTAEARDAFGANLSPIAGDSWSDYEEWEAPAEEWPHIRVVV